MSIDEDDLTIPPPQVEEAPAAKAKAKRPKKPQPEVPPPVDPVAAGEIPPEKDPFDPANACIGTGNEEWEPEEDVKVIACRKPGRQEWFRTHPTIELRVGLLRDEETKVEYLVAPRVFEQLDDEGRRSVLHLSVNRQGSYFLFPIAVRDPDGRDNGWVESAERAMLKSKREWTRMKSNMRAGEYKVAGLEADIPDPTWPDLTERELLRLAFADRFVSSMDHPLVRKLRGLA